MKPPFKGITASSGIAFGHAFMINEPTFQFTESKVIDIKAEQKKFDDALNISLEEIAQLREKVAQEQNDESAAIFDAHQMLLRDPEVIQSVHQLIETEEMNAAWALKETIAQYIALFEQLDDDYMKERITDIKDVSNRLFTHLFHTTAKHQREIVDDTILVAKDITPSDIAIASRDLLKGFITDNGGLHAHASIIARTTGIPAIVNSEIATKVIEDGDFIIIDGFEQTVFVNPDEATIRFYREKVHTMQMEKEALALLKDKPTITLDHKNIQLSANIASSADLERVLNNGAEGIGLFRTEFSYMKSNHFPSEEQTFLTYKTILEGMGELPVVIRTLDIGADKQLDYWDLPKEENPFLGLRAIRLSLSEQQIFKTQLRALLRASIHGNLHVMFPMISTMEELNEVKGLLEAERRSLEAKGIIVSHDIKIGIMIETPAAAIMAHEFAKEVDFFSIGTNDLIQYTFAADRMNETVAHLYEPYHPAILRFIKMVIDAANEANINVSVCGEVASNEDFASLLIGLGIHELSMPPSTILEMRNFIRQVHEADLKQLAEEAIDMKNAEEVKALIKDMAVTC